MKKLKLGTFLCLAALSFMLLRCSDKEPITGGELGIVKASSSLKSMPVAGTISAQYSDSPSGEDIAKVVDGNTNTKYLTFHNICWLQWKGNATFISNQYSITSANDAAERDPKNWTLYGSNDGTTWTNLNSQSNQAFTARFQKKTYTFTNSTPFLYYKLDITANNGGTILQLAEWDMVSAGVVAVYQDCSFGGYAVVLPEGSYTLSTLVAKGIKDNDLLSPS